MKYVCALMCVGDIDRSRAFYTETLRQTVKYDFGANVSFEAGFAIHEQSHFASLLDDQTIRLGGNDAELYFEHDDIDGLLVTLQDRGVTLVHPAREQPWRQLVVRFYDPDQHIVEVGESMEHVAWRLSQAGMDGEAISRAISMPLDFIFKAIKHYLELEQKRNTVDA